MKILKLIELVEKTAKADLNLDQDKDPEANAHDYSGGNIDDAYQMGREDGEVNYARFLLPLLKEELIKK